MFALIKNFHPFISKYVLLIAIFLLAFTARLIPGARTIDDAYITYRYTRNILAAEGFVFNPGEAVLGTTTPLYTTLLTILGAFDNGVEANFPLLSLYVNAFADAMACLLLVYIGKRLGIMWVAYSTAFIWAVAPYSVTFAIGGLETSVYTFLLILLIASYLSQRLRLAAVVSAMALLTRPDALLMIIPLFCYHIYKSWSLYYSPVTEDLITPSFQVHKLSSSRFFLSLTKTLLSFKIEFILFAMPIVVWIAFSTLHFGSPLPHSILAKSLAYQQAPESALIRLMQHFATPFLDNLTLGITAIGIGLLLYPFLFMVGARSVIKTNRDMLPMALFPWIYFMAFAFANPLIFRWYLTPPLPFYFIFILAGLDQLITFGYQRIINGYISIAGIVKSHKFTLIGARLLLLSIIPFLYTLKGWDLHPDHGLNRPAPKMAWYKLELLYKKAADFLNPLMTSETVLAAGDVGVLGYYTPARILDTVGLNSPQTLKYYPIDKSIYAINYAISPELILSERPDYLVILEVYGRKGLLIDDRFRECYQLLEKYPTDIYGSDGLLIYKRSDIP